jgi:hypothetical protein
MPHHPDEDQQPRGPWMDDPCGRTSRARRATVVVNPVDSDRAGRWLTDAGEHANQDDRRHAWPSNGSVRHGAAERGVRWL